METVTLPLGDKTYQIHIGDGLLSDSTRLRTHIAGRQVFVVSNETVAAHYLDAVTSGLSDHEIGVHLMPDGEQYKTLAAMEAIVGDLLAQGHNRGTTIIALGGGVVGDTAGFAAASYQRGVPFIQVPTTLLSQVDSSVGGKTAVNHALGKNMIGAFYQPKAVYIDTGTLSTLPARELSAGLAEVIKHGILADRHYFDDVERSMPSLLALDPETLARVIRGSCEIKAAIVAEDEKEAGRRALLNLGHTFGHAIETALGYGGWLHGEAVGAGLVMAADLSLRLGRCAREEAVRIRQLVSEAGLPCYPPAELDAETLLAMMSKDKKADDTGIRFVLLAGGIGRTELVDNVPMSELEATLKAGEALCS